MPIYTSSKGEEKDTANMPLEYIQHALAKAKAEGNENNVDALEYELKQRNGQ